jgi:uncharacterized protein
MAGTTSGGIKALALAQWRRQTAEMYARARESSATDPRLAWQEYREKRDEMFRSHPQSPLEDERKAHFSGLDWFPYDPAWRLRVPVAPIEGSADLVTEVELPEGRVHYRRVGTISVEPADRGLPTATLTLYWMESYGGGLFLPFKDLTNGTATYGGGRYLYDTIKGADLGAGPDAIVLDFNFAYNPSCAYSPEWVCPLSPRENALPFSVPAGERAFS